MTKTVRDASHNSMHAALLVMLDDSQQDANNILVTLASPLRSNMGQALGKLRARDDVRKFYIDIAKGDWLGSLCDVVKLTQDSAALEQMGVQTRAIASLAGPPTDLEIYDNECKAKLIMDFACSLLRFRSRRMAHYTFGLPHSAAALLSTDPEVVIAKLKFFKLVHDAYKALDTRTEHLAHVMRNRSSLMQQYVATLMDLLHKENFEVVSPSAKRLLANSYDNIIWQAVVTENFIQRERTAESMDQLNSAMTWDRVWWLPIQRKLLPNDFKMPEVDLHREVPCRTETPPLSCAMASPKVGDLSDPRLRDVVGVGPPSWKTFTTRSAAAQYVDVLVASQLQASNKWDHIGETWMSAFLVENMMVREHGSEQWWWSLGHIECLMTIAWPMERLEEKGGVVWRLRTDVVAEDLGWLLCLDPRQWEAQEVSWQSPLERPS